MKFRADEKDIKTFIIFCVVLLYLCAVAVANVRTLATEGTFSGLLPFKGFLPGNILYTLFLFFAVLITAFVSVKSYFFDRDKGFGIDKKKDKGYSRWCTDKEMKKTLSVVNPRDKKLEHGGIVVINNGKKVWVDDGEGHNLVMGATGSGKTQIVVFPMIKILAKAGESMILTDPKGELYEETSEMLRSYGYNVIVLNFRDPQKGNAWNPMGLPYKLYQEGNTDKAVELLDDLALNILYDEKNTGDPFWEKTAADYFTGLALGLFEDASEEQVNLNSMNLMSNLGEERYGGPNNNYIKEYFKDKDPSRPAYINASGTVFAPEDTKGGVLSTFKQKVKLFSSRDNLSEMLSYSDFDMKEIGRKKTAVFMVVQDEKKTLHPLATIFIKQCYETLIDVAQESGGHLPYRTNFILDEFANMPPLKDVTTMVTAARSRHIRFTFIIQNFAQLTQVYGKENAETIKGNCNILYLISAELQALEELSKLCGEVKSKEKEKTSSTPLVTVSDLQRMVQNEAISLRLRMMPYKTKLIPNWQMNNKGMWGEVYGKGVFPEREKKEVQLFDIREYVKERKKQKMEEMMSSSDIDPSMGMDNPFGANPFGGGPFGGNPFGGLPPEGGLNSLIGNNQGSDNDDESFNVDDLVKKIDAKIAELEEEERKEKEEQAIANEEKPSEVKEDSSMYDDGTNSESFFDDFFSDDE